MVFTKKLLNLLKLYSWLQIAGRKHWQTEALCQTPTDLGGKQIRKLQHDDICDN